MRIVADHDELDEVSRMIADVATTTQELAVVARRRVQAVALPGAVLQAVAPIMDSISRTLASASEVFVAESEGLRRRASCCASEEASGLGGLSALAADNWVAPTPSTADVVLGFHRSTTHAALVDAILDWQETGRGSAPDTGVTVITGSPIAAFEQLLDGPEPGGLQTISGSGYFPEIGAILHYDGPLIDLGTGEAARAQLAYDNALTTADRMNAITPGMPRGQSSPPTLPSPNFQLDLSELMVNPGTRIAYPETAGLAIPIQPAAKPWFLQP